MQVARRSVSLENVPAAPRQERRRKRECMVPPRPSSVMWMRTSLRNSSALCSWRALSLSAHGLSSFPFPRILHQTGRIYLFYLSTAMTQLTEMPELGERISRNASCHCQTTDNTQHGCSPFSNPPYFFLPCPWSHQRSAAVPLHSLRELFAPGELDPP